MAAKILEGLRNQEGAPYSMSIEPWVRVAGLVRDVFARRKD